MKNDGASQKPETGAEGLRFGSVKDAVSRELGHLVSSLSANKIFVAIWAVVVPVLSLNYYLKWEGVPLSVVSSGALASLPVVLAMMVWIVVLLLFCFSCPAIVVLLLPGGDRLASGFFGNGACVCPGWYLGYFVSWLVVTAVCFVAAPHVFCEYSVCNDLWALVFGLVSLFCWVVFVVRVLKVDYLYGEGFWEKSPVTKILDVAWFGCSVFAIQSAVVFGGYDLWRDLGFFDSQYSFLFFCMFIQVGVVVVGVFLWSAEKKLVVLCTVLMLLVLFCALNPFSARFLVSDLFSRSEMGGRDCIVFGFYSRNGVDPGLLSSERSGGMSSVPLRVVFASPSTIYARPWSEGREQGEVARAEVIYQFSRSAISRSSRCDFKPSSGKASKS